MDRSSGPMAAIVILAGLALVMVLACGGFVALFWARSSAVTYQALPAPVTTQAVPVDMPPFPVDTPKLAPPPAGMQGPMNLDAAVAQKLEFEEQDGDLLVTLWIDGPAARQVVLAEYSIDYGKPNFEEQLHAADGAPPRQPSIALRYLLLVNEDLPGFTDPGLLNAPTPPEEREKQRQKVTWRIPRIADWGFTREEAQFTVQETRFEAKSAQLRAALPEIEKTITEHESRQQGQGSGGAAP